MSPDATNRLHRWLQRLPAEPLARISHAHAERARALGLCVTQPDGGEKPIPPLLSAVIAEDAWIEQVERDCARLAALIHRVCAGMLAGPERQIIVDALFPFERVAIESAGLPDRLATVRADLFLGKLGAQALELNATIPAMQGYGDIAARAFIEAAGGALGLSNADVEETVRDNGENALCLLDALEAMSLARVGRPFERVALLHRPMDAQLSELRYLARRWEQTGIRAIVAESTELVLDGDGAAVRGERVDFVYRHIFARRVEAASALGQLLQKPERFPLSNPVAAPLEMKRTFAELSRTAHESELAKRYGLSDDDRALVTALVPWTRALVPGPTHGPAGEDLADLVQHVVENPAPYVIKRSWDYGGRAVFLGFEADLPVTRERAKAAFDAELSWPELVHAAAKDPRGGGFVVQERVATAPHEHLVVVDGHPTWRPFFTDFSMYASLGVPNPRWGGVVRASTSAVVNIASGGGVAPVLRARAARKILDAIAKTERA